MMHDIASAFAFAEQAHSNHIGYDGKPYFPHIAWVVREVENLIDALPAGTFTKDEDRIAGIVACLHDCVEDEEHTGVTYAHLEQEGFEDDVIRRVRRLDGRTKAGSYQQNIEAMVIEGDKIVILTKLADNRHNRLPERIASLPESKRGIIDRYRRAGRVLEAAYAEMGGTPQPVL